MRKLTDPQGTLREALAQMRTAEDALDQAHAMLRDLGLDKWIDTGSGPYRQTVGSAYEIVAALIDDLSSVKCPDCGEPMAERTACLANRCPSLVAQEAAQ